MGAAPAADAPAIVHSYASAFVASRPERLSLAGALGDPRPTTATPGLHCGAGACPRPEPAARDGVGGEAPQGLLDPVVNAVAPRRGQGGAEGGHRGRRQGDGGGGKGVADDGDVAGRTAGRSLGLQEGGEGGDGLGADRADGGQGGQERGTGRRGPNKGGEGGAQGGAGGGG
jgi:hypothetical protein